MRVYNMCESLSITGARPVLATSLAILLHAASSLTSDAALIITYAESPGEMNSTLSGTSVLNFNSLPAGARQSNLVWSGVGTIDLIYVLGADRYGGATSTGLVGGPVTNYVVQSSTVGGANATATTTLTFVADQAYFGLWWSAGDASNQLRFYKDGLLVADYSTETLLEAVAGDVGYKGNPTTTYQGLNGNEAYAFINFYGMDGVTWDTISFSNVTTSGFESDNWTSRAIAYGELPGEDPGDLPGKAVAVVTGTVVTAIPEPKGAVIAGLVAAALLLKRRRNLIFC